MRYLARIKRDIQQVKRSFYRDEEHFDEKFTECMCDTQTTLPPLPPLPPPPRPSSLLGRQSHNVISINTSY